MVEEIVTHVDENKNLKSEIIKLIIISKNFRFTINDVHVAFEFKRGATLQKSLIRFYLYLNKFFTYRL